MKLLISSWSTAVPPSFVVCDEETILMFEKIPASSAAWIVTSPAAVTPEPSIVASALLETLFCATTRPIALPFALKSADGGRVGGVRDRRVQERGAVGRHGDVAAGVDRRVRDRRARRATGPRRSARLAISGSPRIESARLKRMFCEFQPIELNASAIASGEVAGARRCEQRRVDPGVVRRGDVDVAAGGDVAVGDRRRRRGEHDVRDDLAVDRLHRAGAVERAARRGHRARSPRTEAVRSPRR